MAGGLHEFLLRLGSLFRKRRLDREMGEELEFHQAMLREKLLREGTPQAEIQAATRRTFGNPARWHERLRELWQFRALQNLLRDLSFSTRLLAKSPGFTAVALLTLALGVGANTAVFSLINGLLLRPLPVPHSEELVVLRFDEPQPQYGFSAPLFRGLERRHEVFTDVFAYMPQTLQVRGHSGNQEIDGVLVSGQYFRALQTPPLLGRYLTPQDDQRGGNPAGFAAVISESFWENWFDGRPDVIGQKLLIDNAAFTVAGVMPKHFIGADPSRRPEIYLPLSAEPIVDAPYSMLDAGNHAWFLMVAGRLRPDVTLKQANAALLTASDPVLREGPDAAWIADQERIHSHFVAEPGSRGFNYLRMLFGKPLAATFTLCGGVLLLACLNLASLLMARSAARKRELATRLALGATRKRLVQQLLSESLLIAILGTAIGLLVSPAVSRVLATLLIGGERGTYLDTSLDWRVFLFAALLSIAAALFIGVAPALQTTAGNLNGHLKDGQHATRALERRFLPRVLLGGEVALATILMIGAGLLAASLSRLYRTGIGFDPKGLVNINLSMDKQPLDGDALLRLYQNFGDGLHHQPGVKSVSFANITPFTGRSITDDFSVYGGKNYELYMNSIAPGYFQTMSIPILHGRDFHWNNTKQAGLKIILNQSAAKLLFPGRDALGQSISSSDKSSYEVVAVVSDTKYMDIRKPPPPAGYLPITQSPAKKPSYKLPYMAVVRLEGPPGPLATAARSLAARLAPDIPAPIMTTMSGVIDDSLRAERMMAILAVFFAGCALLVTAIGLYGTLAYTTERRTSEIGIRMALGAQRRQIVSMVFRENAVIAATGSVAGLIVALIASRTLTSFLYGTSPRDPGVLVFSMLALVMIASAASLLPAVRAARIQPMTAIRSE